jgi:1-acyl-sn-glycerol-3-phosphate acyltransferase
MLFWIVRSIVWILLRLIFWWVGGFRVEGRHNVPKRTGCLIAPNHFSDGDPPVVGFAMPRACYFMAKEELFSIRFWGKLIRILHGFPVKRYTADRTALKFAESRLKEGEAVVIFPEGKLSEDGNLQSFLPGLILIAQRAGVPIIPTALIHTNLMMPYSELKPRRIGKPLIVRFGEPVTVEQLMGDLKGSAGFEEGARRLHAMVQALLDNRPYPQLTSGSSDSE